jgi:hypothetical protein
MHLYVRIALAAIAATLAVALINAPEPAAEPGCANPDGSPCAPAGPGCVDPNTSLPCSSSLPDVNAAIRHELQSILGSGALGGAR